MPHWTLDEPAVIEFEPAEGPIREVAVRIVAGHVDVVATDGPPRLELSDLDGAPLQVRLEGGRLTVTYDDLTWQGLLDWVLHTRREAVLSLAMPRECTVELGVVSASALVSGTSGRTAVRSVSGDVVLDHLGEAIEAQTVSGDLETRGVTGALRFTTVSGDLTVVDGASGSLQAKTVSGDLTVDLALAQAGTMRLDSVSGDVTVRLSSGAGCSVDVRTTSGHLDSAFSELEHERKPGRARLGGRIGTGTGHLTARTVSGDVALLRRDGAPA